MYSQHLTLQLNLLLIMPSLIHGKLNSKKKHSSNSSRTSKEIWVNASKDGDKLPVFPDSKQLLGRRVSIGLVKLAPYFSTQSIRRLLLRNITELMKKVTESQLRNQSGILLLREVLAQVLGQSEVL